MTDPNLYFWPVTIHGRWMLRLPAYRAIRWLDDSAWERERISSMWLNLRKTDTLFDIGAETGDMSALFASWLTEGGVALVEPNERAWPGIKAIWTENALPPPLASFVGFCAAQEDPMSPVALEGWPHCAAGLVDPAHGFAHLAEQGDTIPCTTVDCLALDAMPDALTIDVEGAELEVLKGAYTTLTQRRPLVWASLHPEFLRHHFGQTVQDVKRFMHDLDYDAVHLADDHESHYLFEPR